MHSNIAITKKMLEYSTRHRLSVPRVMPNVEVWGTGKRVLAWRVSGHLKKRGKPVPQSAQHTLKLDKFFFPPEKPLIQKVDYKWAAPLSARIGAPPHVVLHHTVGTGTPQLIHQMHLNIGDRGIAYHYYIRKDGTIYQGRPDTTIGAHCYMNNNSIGVAFEGNYDTTPVMPAVQMNAGKKLMDYLRAKYPNATARRHKDMPSNATACPGRYFPLADIVR